MPIEILNQFVGIATVAMQLIAFALLVVYALRGKNNTVAQIGDSVGKWGLWAALTLTLAAVGMVLWYSALGFEACTLCWWQRIFLFPQAILFALAIGKDEGGRIADYSITFSVAGLGVALYQHILQMFPNSLPCPATGISCAQRLLFELGYITFPLVAASVFVLLIIVMLFVRERM